MVVIIKPSSLKVAQFKAQQAPRRQVVNSRTRTVAVKAQKEPFAKADEAFTAQEQQYQSQIDNASDDQDKEILKGKLEELRQQRELSYSAYQTFSFAGVPEDVNGRMCMLAFTYGTIKEALTGQTIAQQTRTTPIAVWIIFFLFIVASIIPSVRNANRKDWEVGPFTEAGEVILGRAAMLGFAGELIIELIAQRPLLSLFGVI